MNEFPLYYYMHYKNKFIEKQSSGGAFYFLAEEFLKLNGSVYGVRFNSKDPLKCEFSRATTERELVNFFGSKYIHLDYSNYNNILKKVKDDLDNDKYVLFSGKACDINKLKKFLGNFNDYKKLYIACIICTGFHKDINDLKNILII